MEKILREELNQHTNDCYCIIKDADDIPYLFKFKGISSDYHFMTLQSLVNGTTFKQRLYLKDSISLYKFPDNYIFSEIPVDLYKRFYKRMQSLCIPALKTSGLCIIKSTNQGISISLRKGLSDVLYFNVTGTGATAYNEKGKKFTFSKKFYNSFVNDIDPFLEYLDKDEVESFSFNLSKESIFPQRVYSLIKSKSSVYISMSKNVSIGDTFLKGIYFSENILNRLKASFYCKPLDINYGKDVVILREKARLQKEKLTLETIAEAEQKSLKEVRQEKKNQKIDKLKSNIPDDSKFNTEKEGLLPAIKKLGFGDFPVEGNIDEWVKVKESLYFWFTRVDYLLTCYVMCIRPVKSNATGRVLYYSLIQTKINKQGTYSKNSLVLYNSKNLADVRKAQLDKIKTFVPIKVRAFTRANGTCGYNPDNTLDTVEIRKDVVEIQGISDSIKFFNVSIVIRDHRYCLNYSIDYDKERKVCMGDLPIGWGNNEVSVLINKLEEIYPDIFIMSNHKYVIYKSNGEDDIIIDENNIIDTAYSLKDCQSIIKNRKGSYFLIVEFSENSICNQYKAFKKSGEIIDLSKLKNS